jgi:hypothetical protein
MSETLRIGHGNASLNLGKEKPRLPTKLGRGFFFVSATEYLFTQATTVANLICSIIVFTFSSIVDRRKTP